MVVYGLQNDARFVGNYINFSKQIHLIFCIHCTIIRPQQVFTGSFILAYNTVSTVVAVGCSSIIMCLFTKLLSDKVTR
jgi:hypothetical protein